MGADSCLPSRGLLRRSPSRRLLSILPGRLPDVLGAHRQGACDQRCHYDSPYRGQQDDALQAPSLVAPHPGCYLQENIIRS